MGKVLSKHDMGAISQLNSGILEKAPIPSLADL